MATSAPPSNPDPSPSRSNTLLWHALAKALAIPVFHVLVMIGVCHAMGWTVDQYARASDGGSYLWKAARFLGDEFPASGDDQRVFPGYPMLIAGLVALTGFSLQWAGLSIAWLSSAALSITGTLWLRRPTYGWLLWLVPGGFLIRKSMVASEPLFLFLCVLGCAVGTTAKRPMLAGVILALAGIVRPNAIFPIIGLTLVLMIGRQWRAIARYAVGGIVMALFLVTVAYLLGEGLFESTQGYQRAYGGRIFDWPGAALVKSIHPAALRNPNLLFVVWFYAITLTCIVVLAIEAWRRRGEHVLHLVWLGGNTLFTLCVGTYMGVVFAPRFLSWAVPSIIVVAMMGLNPTRKRLWITTAVLLVLTVLTDVALTIVAREVR